MEPQSTTTGNFKATLMLRLFCLALTLFSFEGFSQSKPSTDNKTQVSLQQVVDNIKQENKSIKNADHVNVMVNDLLIKDLKDFTIDPKSIAMVEVLVLNPRSGSTEPIKSIIINTK